MSANKACFSRIIEISSEYADLKNQPEEFPLSAEKMLWYFFEKIVYLDALDFIVFHHGFWAGMGAEGRINLQRVCFDKTALIREKNFFIKKTMKYGATVAVRPRGDELINLYSNGNWSASGVSFADVVAGVGEYLDARVLELVSRLGGSMFVFNHDADPVYYLDWS